MADTTVHSTPVLQAVAAVGGIQTTMQTCEFTLLNPNLTPVVGPIGITPLSTGVYQYAVPTGLLNLPGVWTSVWYVQNSGSALQTTSTFTVAP